MINFIDDFLDEDKYHDLYEYCLHAPYYFGEVDSPTVPPRGMVSKISEDNLVFTFLRDKIKEKVECTRNLGIYRMYINCFAPREIPFYHVDHKELNVGITCLLYLNYDFDINEGGETQFIIQNDSINILPIPNRLCFFDAGVLHRATSFANKHRFTIAVKYMPL